MSSTDQSEANKAVAADPSERRRNVRFPFTAALEAVESKSGTKVSGRTSDLSLGGCYVDTLSPFPVGTEAKIRILREKESFEANAKVVYSAIGMGMGLAFVSAQPKQVRVFQKWLNELSGQSGPSVETTVQEEPEASPVESGESVTKSAVLSDLIMTLMQKRVLTETEGKELLRKLFK